MPKGRSRAVGELTRLLATLALVMGSTAALLRGLDALPGLLLGQPRGVSRYGSIEEVERQLGARVLLPSFFPDTLRWPPAGIRLARRPTPAVALSFVAREGAEPRLFLYQTVGAAGPIPRTLLSPAQRLHATTVTLEGSDGELSRIVGDDGEIWHTLAWQRAGRSFVLRFRGPVEDLLRMARSIGRGVP